MAKNSDDYLDRLSDKDYYGSGSAGDAFVSVFHPAAGLGARAVRKMMLEEEMEGLVDHSYFGSKLDKILYANACALNLGLFWVEMKKHKLLDPGRLYVSANAQKLIGEGAVPDADKVQIDVSQDALLADAPKPDNLFRVPNAATVDASVKNRLSPIDEKALQPEIAHKVITAYTDLNAANCFAKGCLALVGFEDIHAFAGKKNDLLINYSKGSVTYSAKKLGEIKRTFESPVFRQTIEEKRQAYQNREPSANEWKCPACGTVNQNYVGTCGCGARKP